MEAQRYDHLDDVLDRIEREHRQGKWLYRGQARRRPVHRLTEDGRVFELENLYPQSFRFAADYDSVSAEFSERWESEYGRTEALFSAFNASLLAAYDSARPDNEARFGWLDPYAEDLRQLLTAPGQSLFSGFHEARKGLKNPEFIQLNWALAQHYGVVTALLDLTYNPEVAVWFATHVWEDTEAPPELAGDGVIYRFDMESLVAGIIFYNQSLEAESGESFRAPTDKAFIQDLRDISPEFALRPVHQEAAVVSGFDALQFARQFQLAGGLDVFVFPHQDEYAPRELSRDYIIPTEDPFLELSGEFETTWKPQADIFRTKYTKPVVVLTNEGAKFANIPNDGPQPLDIDDRQELYNAGESLLGSDLVAAEHAFERVLSSATEPDRLSSRALARIAVIRLTQGDFANVAVALRRSLDIANANAQGDWVGQHLQTIAQGAQALIGNGQGELALDLLDRLAVVAARAQPDANALEAELGALVTLGSLQVALGDPESGIQPLANVAAREPGDFTPHQRLFVAKALLGLAEVSASAGNKNQARAYLNQIDVGFGRDSLPNTVETVQLARSTLRRLENRRG